MDRPMWFRNREVRVLTGLFVAQAAVRGALGVLIVVAAFTLLHAGSGWVGFMSAAVGAGGLAATRLAGRPLAVPFALGLLCSGFPLILVAAASQRFTMMLLLVTVGIGNAVEDVSGFTPPAPPQR